MSIIHIRIVHVQQLLPVPFLSVPFLSVPCCPASLKYMYTLKLIVAVVVSKVEIFNNSQRTSMKVAQVGCEISLNRKHPSKHIYAANALGQEKLVSGIKGAFVREVP